MDNNYKNIISEQKQRYHLNRSQMTFEDKIKVIIELQKIDFEFSKIRKKTFDAYKRIWNLEN